MEGIKILELLRQKEHKNYIFGAGRQGEKLLLALERVGVEVQSFLDNDKTKWDTELYGKECMCVQTVCSDKDRVNIIVSPVNFSSIVEQLCSLGFKNVFKADEVLYEITNCYYSCAKIEEGMVIYRDIDDKETYMQFCCEQIGDVPKIPLGKNPEKSIQEWLGYRDMIVMSNRKNGIESGIFISKQCKACAHYKYGKWDSDRRVHLVHLAIYPAPCPARCIYCDYWKKQDYRNISLKKEYEQMINTLKFAVELGVIAEDARWIVSGGEITVHPCKESVMQLVKGRRTTFLTNCFNYDEDIAENLRDNASSYINFSIDAGTAETWKKIKGVDNFRNVLENLRRYREQGARDGQIQFKYILLLGMNNTLEDYSSIVELMKELGVRKLVVSRDHSLKYSADSNIRKMLVESAVDLIHMCQDNGIETELTEYLPNEVKQIEILLG